MSLINDALKRAKQAQKPSPPAPATPMQRVTTGRSPGGNQSLILPIFVAAALLLVGGLAILFAVSRIFHRTAAAERPGVANPPATISSTGNFNPAVAAPKPATPALVSNIVARAPATPVESSPLQPQVAERTSVVPTVGVGVASNPAPAMISNSVPSLPRLQGIVFNPARPTAFLDGKSVVVGGRVGEFKVLAITRQAVTVERSGQTNVLSLEE